MPSILLRSQDLYTTIRDLLRGLPGLQIPVPESQTKRAYWTSVRVRNVQSLILFVFNFRWESSSIIPHLRAFCQHIIKLWRTVTRWQQRDCHVLDENDPLYADIIRAMLPRSCIQHHKVRC
jgi:hypothetical protein